MKKYWIALLFLILMGGLMGCSNNPLTLEDIQAAFEEQGLSLQPLNQELSPGYRFTMELNGIQPHVFELKDKVLAVYVFDSEKERLAGKEDFANKTATALLVGHFRFEVNNVLIFYVHERNQDPDLETRLDNAIRLLDGVS